MRGRKRKNRERVEGRGFMDVAREAFVRYMALDKWREIDDMRETLGFDWPKAVREASRFPSRRRYEPLWTRKWEELVIPVVADAESGRLFAAIEGAIAEAVRDESEQRRSCDDRPLEEDGEYKGFIDAALASLSREAAGGLEPM